jgi:NTP pyrophosphatase (non-canonical NTP hydrolase)
MNFDQFDEFQALSVQTDQQPSKQKLERGLLIPLLGLAGETGTLLAEFKKRLRDGRRYEGFNDKAEEELGDILWYVSNVASRLGIALSSIATKNLRKTQERWPVDHDKSIRPIFDLEYPLKEQLPRIAKIRVFQDEKKIARLELLPDRCLLGDKLTDNAYQDDGYRFHDVMHLAHWAVLGWSPVMRKMLDAKRRSRPDVDEIEDGARALIVEELLVAFVYSDATRHGLYKSVRHLDSEMLSTLKRLVLHLEVRQRPVRDWEEAIKQGYRAFRHLRQHGEATFSIDMTRRKLQVVP